MMQSDSQLASLEALGRFLADGRAECWEPDTHRRPEATASHGYAGNAIGHIEQADPDLGSRIGWSNDWYGEPRTLTPDGHKRGIDVAGALFGLTYAVNRTLFDLRLYIPPVTQQSVGRRILMYTKLRRFGLHLVDMGMGDKPIVIAATEGHVLNQFHTVLEAIHIGAYVAGLDERHKMPKTAMMGLN